MSASLVGSEMCIRDRPPGGRVEVLRRGSGTSNGVWRSWHAPSPSGWHANSPCVACCRLGLHGMDPPIGASGPHQRHQSGEGAA
eukprot:12175722-Alexandrium_andersonii.AAC.1